MKHLATPDQAPLRSTRVLLVEDDDCLYQALRDSLQDAGCEVFGSCERVCFPIDTVPASRLDAAFLDMDPLGSARAASLAQQLGARNMLGNIACVLGKKLEIPHSDCGERPPASANE